jgi:hypothetical protein
VHDPGPQIVKAKPSWARMNWQTKTPSHVIAGCLSEVYSGELDEVLIEPQTLPNGMIEFLHSISFPQQKVIARLSTG